jgi:hypothetical protein
MADKYIVQTRYNNPEPVVLHSRKLYVWADSSRHHTLSEAKKVRAPHQRIIKLTTPSEGALSMDSRGRRFNAVVDPNPGTLTESPFKHLIPGCGLQDIRK